MTPQPKEDIIQWKQNMIDATGPLVEETESLSLSETRDTTEKIKENINIVFVGHVDAGKSTISGQILYWLLFLIIIEI